MSDKPVGPYVCDEGGAFTGGDVITGPAFRQVAKPEHRYRIEHVVEMLNMAHTHQERRIAELVPVLRKTLAAAVELHAQGIQCPDCPADAEDTGADCPMLISAEVAVTKAEAES